MSYATDGRCHNSEPGTFNHECGKPAVWIGTKVGEDGKTFESGFCDRCKREGYEARRYKVWRRADGASLNSKFPFQSSIGGVEP